MKVTLRKPAQGPGAGRGVEEVTRAVHEGGGRILLQLWHVGRVSDPADPGGQLPVAPSAIAPGGNANLLRPARPFGRGAGYSSPPPSPPGTLGGEGWGEGGRNPGARSKSSRRGTLTPHPQPLSPGVPRERGEY